jgi:hypothetical protein
MIDAGWNAGALAEIDGPGRPFDVLSIDSNGVQG